LTIYFATWRKLDQDKAEAKWGDKYDVFYVPNEAQSRAAWTLDKYVDVAALPGIGRVRWETNKLSERALERLGNVDRAGWLALHVIGLLWLLRQKRFREVAWLWSPILVMLLFNVFGRWPAGAFRVNAGIVPFTLFLAGFGLDAATALKPPLARPLLAFGALLTLGPALLMRPDWFQKGTFARPGRFGEVFEVLVASKPRSQRVVLMENGSCRPWTYYSGFDTGLDADMTARIRKRFRKNCTGGALAKGIYALARQRADFWVLLTDRRKDTVADQATKKACEKVERTAVGGGLHVLWHCWPKKENQE
jgi:hypothetical protein